MKNNANGFATKKDLKRLEKKMDIRFKQVDKRFEQVDKRFEQVDKRFEQVDKRFEQVNGQFSWLMDRVEIKLDDFEKRLFTKFNNSWTTKIDPILAEIEKHREKEIIWAEQNRRTENLLHKIADKIGIQTD